MVLEQYHHGIGSGDIQHTVECDFQCPLEGTPVEEQAESVVFIPDMGRIMAQRLQEAISLAGLGKCDLVQSGLFVGFQELVIALDLDVIGQLRQEAGHLSPDHHGAVGLQHAHPLFAIHHIELTQIFAAADGIDQAGIGQMLLINFGPCFSKLTLNRRQRAEVTDIEVAVSVDANTHNLTHRDLHDAQVHSVCQLIAIESVIQDRELHVSTLGSGST